MRRQRKDIVETISETVVDAVAEVVKPALTIASAVKQIVNMIVKLSEDPKSRGIYSCCDLVTHQVQQEIDLYEKQRIKEKMKAKKKEGE